MARSKPVRPPAQSAPADDVELPETDETTEGSDAEPTEDEK